MRLISVRENPEQLEKIIAYFQSRWATEDSRMVYDDCIRSCMTAKSPLPQWYVLMDEEKIVAGAGLITNDFVSQMDLMPWLCALYVEPEYRGNGLGAKLIRRCIEDAAGMGFESLYLCTDHIGYYEKYGFEFLAMGYHPWGESSRIYKTRVR